MSARALMFRVQRRLAKEGKELRKAWGAAARERLGEGYFVLNLGTDVIEESGIGLEDIAVRLNCLRPWEVIEGADRTSAT